MNLVNLVGKILTLKPNIVAFIFIITLSDDRDILIEDSSCINELDDLGKPVVAISSILQDVKLGRKIRSYPWSYDQVPREIDKNICKSSILEIMDYYDFVTPSLKLSTGETSASYKQVLTYLLTS